MSGIEEKGVTFQQETLRNVGLKHSVDEDVGHLISLTEAEKEIEKKLVTRIDLQVMPLVLTVYLLNYIDRNNYAAARIQNMPRDLGMSPTEYQLGLSILFVGYVSMQVPSNALLNYCGKPGWYIGFFTIAWGLVSSLTSQVQGFGGMLACRLLLGIVEAPFFPGMLFYLSKWYTKKELNLRMSIFYSGSLISGAFGSLIAAGILDGLDGARGIAAWRWLYIVEGALTVTVGIVVLFVLPDFPTRGRASQMMLVANRRMALDAGEADVNTGGKMSQLEGLKQAFLDPKTYILAIAYHGVVGAAGFQNFYPSIVATLDFSRVITLLLVAPPYIFTALYSLAHGLASDKFGKRFWFYIYPVPLVIIGAFVFMFTDGLGPRYFSLFLLNMIFVMNGTVYAWIANSIPRPPAKRAAALAFINSVGNSASIWTPFTYSASQEPYYRQAMGINIGLTGIAGILGVVMFFYLTAQNKQLARMENADTPLTDGDIKKLQKTAELEGIDFSTARMLQKGFRYIV